MPFLIRPSRRFPVCCPVAYQCGLFERHGTVGNLSLTGWRFSGNLLPLRIGELCSLTVNLRLKRLSTWPLGLSDGREVRSMGLKRS